MKTMLYNQNFLKSVNQLPFHYMVSGKEECLTCATRITELLLFQLFYSRHGKSPSYTARHNHAWDLPFLSMSLDTNITSCPVIGKPSQGSTKHDGNTNIVDEHYHQDQRSLPQNYHLHFFHIRLEDIFIQQSSPSLCPYHGLITPRNATQHNIMQYNASSTSHTNDKRAHIQFHAQPPNPPIKSTAHTRTHTHEQKKLETRGRHPPPNKSHPSRANPTPSHPHPPTASSSLSPRTSPRRHHQH